MSDPVFFRREVTPTLADIIAWTGAKAPEGFDLATAITDLCPLEQGAPGSLVFLDNPKYAGALEQTRASACLLSARQAARAPAHVAPLVVAEPYKAFALVSGRMYPAGLRPQSAFGASGVSPGSFVHPEARLEAGVVVDPGAVIGPRAQIGGQIERGEP